MRKTAEQLIAELHEAQLDFVLQGGQVRLLGKQFDHCPITALADHKGHFFDLYIPYAASDTHNQSARMQHYTLLDVLNTTTDVVLAIAHAADYPDLNDPLTTGEEHIRQELLAMVVCK